ncbi:MAG: hypothetical protein ACREMD_10295 [Gemmatimonadota bacterium]
MIAQPFEGSGEAFLRASLDLLQSDSLIVEGAKQPEYRIEYADRMKGSIGVWEIDVTDSSGDK